MVLTEAIFGGVGGLAVVAIALVMVYPVALVVDRVFGQKKPGDRLKSTVVEDELKNIGAVMGLLMILGVGVIMV